MKKILAFMNTTGWVVVELAFAFIVLGGAMTVGLMLFMSK